MKENIWLLQNKTAFDECDVSQVQVTQKTDFFVCDDPTRLVFLSLLFLEHAAGMNDRTFVGGSTYYLIATSHGTQSSVNDLSGGHCNHTSKNVHMKIEVYVCNKTGDRICNSKNVGILTCPPPVTPAPYTSPYTTTLTHRTQQRINITESVVTDKSETVSKLPRTEGELTGTVPGITGEKTTETTWPGSTKNEAKRGKRMGENDEFVKMRKTRNLWMTIAICFFCIAGVLLTVIVFLVVRNYSCYAPGCRTCWISRRVSQRS
ncbi:PREDICTED: uncharacterized protein LOC107341287 [Acropora digitifera]|uniref:uncharacterized protein LOC107341287 n=1 Tax=Acropora digitifera TaxID=70779 RepID=UPI00077A6E90|nr:PREDICTED: uncharacterized protein LOC107341287 [Acropora digitifera]